MAEHLVIQSEDEHVVRHALLTEDGGDQLDKPEVIGLRVKGNALELQAEPGVRLFAPAHGFAQGAESGNDFPEFALGEFMHVAGEGCLVLQADVMVDHGNAVLGQLNVDLQVVGAVMDPALHRRDRVLRQFAFTAAVASDEKMV